MYVDLILKLNIKQINVISIVKLNENALDKDARGKYLKMQNDPPQGRFAFNFASLKPFGQNNSTKI